MTQFYIHVLCVLSGSVVSDSATLQTAACQAPLSKGILQTRILEWLLDPPSEDPPDPGMKSTSLMSPALAGEFFTTSATWEALMNNGKLSTDLYDLVKC